jgi:hypothetical protein
MRAHKWRTTEIMTKSDCYFLREKRMIERTVMEESAEEHEIEGKRMLVKVMRPKVEMVENDVLIDLTVEEARRVAGADILPG